MDLNGLTDLSQWIYSLVGGIGVGGVTALIGLFFLRKYIKKLSEKTKELTEKIKELKSIELPDSVTYDLTAMNKEEMIKLKTEILEAIGQKLNTIEPKVDAIIETHATARSTSTDRAQALMTLINKPVPKKTVIKIERKPELFKEEKITKGGGNLIEVD